MCHRRAPHDNQKIQRGTELTKLAGKCREGFKNSPEELDLQFFSQVTTGHESTALRPMRCVVNIKKTDGTASSKVQTKLRKRNCEIFIVQLPQIFMLTLFLSTSKALMDSSGSSHINDDCHILKSHLE